MKAVLKITGGLWETIQKDLNRPHAFAHERVGFLTAGAAQAEPDTVLLLGRDYAPVTDEDYVPDDSVGVQIGKEAMRKAVQRAYRPRAALLHIHTHGGHGRPDFSSVDLKSGREFVPAFFHTVPRMPHGMLVLSDNSATGMVWLGEHDPGAYASCFVRVGAPYQTFGRRP